MIALSVSEMKAGNIIFQVTTRCGVEITLEDIIAVQGPFPATSELSYAHKGLTEAFEQELILLEISPSYGATCLVLGRFVQIVNRDGWLARYLGRTDEFSPPDLTGAC